MLLFEGEGWDGPLRGGLGLVATARTGLVRVRIEILLERGNEKQTGSIPRETSFTGAAASMSEPTTGTTSFSLERERKV